MGEGNGGKGAGGGRKIEIQKSLKTDNVLSFPWWQAIYLFIFLIKMSKETGNVEKYPASNNSSQTLPRRVLD